MSDREQVWRDRVACHEESGLTVTEFCETFGVSTASFYQWWKRLSRNHSTCEVKQALFVPVAVRPPERESIALELPQGVHVRIPPSISEQQLTTVLRAAIAAAETASC